MSLRQKAFNATGWSILQNFGSQAISFIIILALAHLLGPTAMGLMALANVFIAFIQVFLDQGVTSALIQRKEIELQHLDSAFWSNVFIGLFLTLISLPASDLVASGFKEPALAMMIRWLAPTFVLGSLCTVQQALLTRQFAFKSLAIRSLVGTIAGGIVGVSMAWFGYGVWSLIGQQLAQQTLNLIVLWFASSWRPRFKFSWKHLKDLWTFGFPVMAFNFTNFFNRSIDDLLVGFYLGSSALGYYSVAYRIVRVIVSLLTNTSLQVGLPTFSRLQQQPERVREAFYSVTQFTSLISFPIFVAIAVLSPELIYLCFGPKWTPSIQVMQVLCLVGVLQSILFFNSTILMAMGKPTWRLMINLVNALVGTLFFFWAVPWGITAVAATYVLTTYFLAPFYVWLVYRLIALDVRIYIKQFFPPLLSSAMLGLFLFIFKVNLLSTFSPLWTIIICVLVGILFYVSTIFFLARNLLQQIVLLIFSKHLMEIKFLSHLQFGAKGPRS